jgi:hypothetical protein
MFDASSEAMRECKWSEGMNITEMHIPRKSLLESGIRMPDARYSGNPGNSLRQLLQLLKEDRCVEGETVPAESRPLGREY